MATDDIIAPGYPLRSETPTTVREATRHTPRDDAEFIVEEVLARDDETAENRSLDEFADGV